MNFFRNKKSELVRDKIGYLLLVAISLVIIFNFIPFLQSTAEAKTSEAICRGSVSLRDQSYTEIKKGHIKIGSIATPLSCRTNDKYIPENKEATKEQIEKEIADMTAKTWQTFGEGRIQDVFKEGDQLNKNCFVFYTLSMRETSKFKGEKGVITSAEMNQYLFEHPYQAYPEGDFCKITGGFCENAASSAGCSGKINAPSTYLLFEPSKDNKVCEKKNRKGCCYTNYACWNKGGICSKENPNIDGYVIYPDWDCPKNTQCYIKKGNYYSYGDYVQKYGGQGNVQILTDIKPGETYAISFGSPNGRCGWCTDIGIGTGAGVATTVIWAGALGLIPGGWLILGTTTLIGGGTGYIIGKSSTELASDQIGKFFERDINTIYLTTLNQIQSGQHCSIVD